MRTELFAVVVAGFVGCGFFGPGVYEDTGEDTQGESDADTDADADADADADCDETNLFQQLEIRDPGGACLTDCEANEALDFVVMLTNYCDEAVSFTTPDSCIVVGWSIEVSGNPHGGEEAWVACDDAVTAHEVGSGLTIEVHRGETTALAAGDYVITASLNDPLTSLLVSNITVVQ